MDEENKTVAKDGAEEPSKDENFSFSAMESFDQNTRLDVGPNVQTILSFDTEYRKSDDWSDSVGTIAQEWDPSRFRMQEYKRKCRLNLRAEEETKPWYRQVYTGNQQERLVVTSSFQFEANLPEYGPVLASNQPEKTIGTSSIEAEEKARSLIKADKKTRKLLTELMAKKIVFKSHIESMQPIHDELTTEQGMHTMAMKPVFKDIESKRPWTYAHLII